MNRRWLSLQLTRHSDVVVSLLADPFTAANIVIEHLMPLTSWSDETHERARAYVKGGRRPGRTWSAPFPGPPSTTSTPFRSAPQTAGDLFQTVGRRGRPAALVAVAGTRMGR
jgi:hypothetical protein